METLTTHQWHPAPVMTTGHTIGDEGEIYISCFRTPDGLHRTSRTFRCQQADIMGHLYVE
ncbi:hypothetical protein M514_09012 [Trichuris suis]|uniref:Uncharacterized protein n=1 Tax=Trichuris suis TaxID=68888 RepID=A0A085LYK6_9BILA|nr:hypothetical protein M513_09012 [Trichuris suis]KFD62524.1 hypothetical protein M514_09012 [Trichuris suis]